MNKIGFVILNYKTYQDTLELILNLKEQVWFKDIKIYVVENGSKNESIVELEKVKDKYDFEFIISNQNLGFANGNNLGILKARSDGCEFVICSNSDINVTKQDDFLQRIESIFDKDPKIAIIAPSIKNLDAIYQNPFRSQRFSAKEIIKMKFFYLSYFYKIYYFFRVYVFYELITKLAQKRKKTQIVTPSIKKESSFIYAPHGSFLIFTPMFFKYYEGFDKNTFLYCEEFILAEMLLKQDLLCWFENSIEVLHKESKTTDAIVKNYKEKVKFTLQHTFSSCRYFSKLIRISDVRN